MRHRVEKDALGRVNVPADAYYGSETARAIENFPISGIHLQSGFIKYYLILKKAAATANVQTGKLDSKKGKVIIEACNHLLKEDFSRHFPVDVFQAGAGTSTNMNVNEVVANTALVILRKKKGDYKIIHPNDDVNMSQSTNDTFHSAMHIAAYAVIKLKLLPALTKLENSLKGDEKKFKNIVKTGRTHLQDAVPMTLGEEFLGYRGAITSIKKDLSITSEKLLRIPAGGTAIGTGINVQKGFAQKFLKELKKLTKTDFKMSEDIFTAMQNQLAEVAVSNSLKECAIALNKIANDLRLLTSGPRGGIGELMLPAVQPGSSIMPGKVNPSIPEMMNMVCFQVMGNNAVISEAASAGQLELNVFMPIIAYNLLFSIDILSNAVNVFEEKCIRGIKADKVRIDQNLRNNLMLATALSPYIGYAKAAQIANKAYKEGKSVKEVCLEMKVLDRQSLDKILDPKKLV